MAGRLAALVCLLLLAGLLAGCTSGEKRQPKQEVKRQAVQEQGDAVDAELESLMQESSDIEAFLNQVEESDALELEL